MDYYDAVQRCESMNSTIVYIENEDEINFLISKYVGLDLNLKPRKSGKKRRICMFLRFAQI